ncbi:hypothetical protein [Streptomyces sp. NPDC059649]|uniref:hypothetical protein n=1 Tax=Streptomyces sp. NPDC059649 TaxID=3346895 RepID=UPI0036CB0941
MNAIISSPAPATDTPPAKKAAPSCTPLIELRHIADPLDRAFMRLAAEHGDRVSTLADYPVFAAQFAGGTSELLASLSGGDLPATAAREGRCLMSPIGCGRPLGEIADTRVFGSQAEAARYEAEWRITGLCPDCQDRIDADEEADRG